MIGIARLSRILRTIAVSGAIDSRSRLSAILIAPSDAGKSELLLSHLPPGARVLDDFTTAGLLNLLDKERPDWIVVPDLNAVISHKPAVANLTMANLLSLLGEGTSEILSPDGSKIKVSDDPIRIGLLTGVTPDMFFSRRGRWRATGFLRRLVPIYYTYGRETQTEIQTAIVNGHDTSAYTRNSVTVRSSILSVKLPLAIARPVRDLAEDAIRYQLKWAARAVTATDDGPRRETRAFELPFTLHKLYRRYVRAHAALHGRRRVTHADLAGLTDFHRFVRYDEPEIL